MELTKLVFGCVLTCAVLLAGLVGLSARQAEAETSPWTVGHCYRATILEPPQQHTLRVLEPPSGVWVRVQSDPRSPRVPGASGRGRVWLNTLSVFSVEEVECAGFPH